MGLTLEIIETATLQSVTPEVSNTLIMQSAPQPRPAKGPAASSAPMGKKNPDYAKRDAQNRKLGRAGELLVVAYESARLAQAGRSDLARLVTHVAVDEGDNAGYDVRSFHDDGRIKFIEVKTTKGGPLTDFFASSNEVAFSEKHSDDYALYRLYNFDEKANAAEGFEIDGPLSKNFLLTPTQFKMRWVEEKSS
jgi:hypothetical protein